MGTLDLRRCSNDVFVTKGERTLSNDCVKGGVFNRIASAMGDDAAELENGEFAGSFLSCARLGTGTGLPSAGLGAAPSMDSTQPIQYYVNTDFPGNGLRRPIEEPQTDPEPSHYCGNNSGSTQTMI